MTMVYDFFIKASIITSLWEGSTCEGNSYILWSYSFITLSIVSFLLLSSFWLLNIPIPRKIPNTAMNIPILVQDRGSSTYVHVVVPLTVVQFSLEWEDPYEWWRYEDLLELEDLEDEREPPLWEWIEMKRRVRIRASRTNLFDFSMMIWLYYKDTTIMNGQIIEGKLQIH